MSEVLVDDDALPEVAASEAELIRLARALVGGDGAEVWPLLAASVAMPDAIGPTCEALLEDALRQAWPALWRRGVSVGARPWSRAAPIGLAFGGPTLELLQWMVGTPLGAPPSTHAGLPAPRAPMSIGDQVMVYLALALGEDTPAQAALAMQPLAQETPLAWLGFAHVLGAVGAKPPRAFSPGAHQAGTAGASRAAESALRGARGTFHELVGGAGALVVEALAPELARRWGAAEMAKRGAVDPVRMTAIGAAQDATLDAWLSACELAGRRDLAAFVIDAAAPMIARALPPEPGTLDRGATLAARSAARVAAGSLLRGVARWAAWDQAHRGVRFIDDDYAAAQKLLSRFEAIGTAGADLAAHWLVQLAALPGA